MNFKAWAVPLVAHLMLNTAVAQFDNSFDIQFHGAGWYQFGSIMHVSDTITGSNNYQGNWTQNYGAVFNGLIDFNEEFTGSFGIGAIKGHTAQGAISNWSALQYFQTTFVNMAELTFTPGGDRATSPFSLTTGLFSYNYDSNIRNLGLYLIRGSVYPQIILSEFESKEMLPIGNLLGARIHSNFGKNYSQDVLLVSESDMMPKFDYSLIYVGNLKFGNTVELGAGFNLYHLIPVRPSLSSPKEGGEIGGDWVEPGGSQPVREMDRTFALDLDTTIIPLAQRTSPEDSLLINREWYSTRGVKLMGRFAFDPKGFFGTGSFGPNDLKLYGEIAVLGVKNYKKIYNNIWERIPLMLGFNFPTFKLLDDFAIEVEYFPNTHMPDYGKLQSQSSPIPRSPYWNRSVVNDENGNEIQPTPYDAKADDWKWSIYLSRVLAGHVKISGQIASDHLRIGSSSPYPFYTFEETFTSPKDWYWMLKSTFFF